MPAAALLLIQPCWKVMQSSEAAGRASHSGQIIPYPEVFIQSVYKAVGEQDLRGQGVTPVEILRKTERSDS